MGVVRRTGSTVAGIQLVPDPGFDARYGFDLDRLLTMTAPDNEPEDFDSFWRFVAGEADAVDPDPHIHGWRTCPGRPDHEIADLSYRSLDGLTVGGWVTRPRAGADQLIVVSHGYHGRSEPTLEHIPDDAATVQPVARGLPDRSHVPGIGGDGLPHVLWGIDNPRSYSHVGSTADLWLAATVGESVLPRRRRLSCVGTSFGGGIATLAIAGDQRFDAAWIEVPSFGNHPWRVTVDCTGSGQTVREHVATHPEAMGTLAYADAATAARRVRIPVLAAAALADPAVPPPGQFSVAMSLGGPTWLHVLPWGHCEWIGHARELAEYQAAIAEFFLDPAESTSGSRTA